MQVTYMFHYGILLPADNINFNEEGEVVRSQIFGWVVSKDFLGITRNSISPFSLCCLPRHNGKITSTPEQVVSSETNPKFSSAKLILTSCVSFGLGY